MDSLFFQCYLSTPKSSCLAEQDIIFSHHLHHSKGSHLQRWKTGKDRNGAIHLMEITLHPIKVSTEGLQGLAWWTLRVL